MQTIRLQQRKRLDKESCALRVTFDQFGELGFIGGMLRVDGKPVAFTIGEQINGEAFVVHFEKALGDYTGAYTMINREFCRRRLGAYRYINREEDMGLEGLRKAKLSLLSRDSAGKIHREAGAMNIGIAAREIIRLRALWLQSFDDTEEAVDAFFARRFRPEDCPSAKREEKCCRRYICCPLSPPAARGRGASRPLHLRCGHPPGPTGTGTDGASARTGGRGWPNPRGTFSFYFLRAARFYDYYAKFGYAEFFSVEEVAVGAGPPAAFCRAGLSDEGAFSAASVARLRARLLKAERARRWGGEALAYAHRMNRIYKGNTLVSPGLRPCRRLRTARWEITELMAEKRERQGPAAADPAAFSRTNGSFPPALRAEHLALSG